MTNEGSLVTNSAFLPSSTSASSEQTISSNHHIEEYLIGNSVNSVLLYRTNGNKLKAHDFTFIKKQMIDNQIPVVCIKYSTNPDPSFQLCDFFCYHA